MSRATLLVVAHAADRAGSVKVLLELIRRIGPELDLPVAIRLEAQGPLADDLLALGSVERAGDRPAAIWVNNAAAAGSLWDHPAETPSLVHVHEEDEALSVLTREDVEALRQLADVVVCVSERSASGVIGLGVPPERVHLVPPPVIARPVGPDEVALVGAELGVGERRLVLGCGEATWRKGADLFIEVAAELAPDPRLTFAWVGRRRPRPFGALLDRDTALRGLGDRLRWLGEVADPGPHLAAASVLIMCSREDPRPLVPLEAALVGTPTVAFDVGGLATMAERGAAATVDFPDCRALAATAQRVLDDEDLAQRLATAGATLARAEQAIEVVTDRMLGLLTAVIGR